MNIFLYIKHLFKSRKENIPLPLPLPLPSPSISDPTIMLDYGTTNVSVHVKYVRYDNIAKEAFACDILIDANKFCAEFREGRGYEYIDRSIGPVPLTMKEREIIINRLREWGHQHQGDV